MCSLNVCCGYFFLKYLSREKTISSFTFYPMFSFTFFLIFLSPVFSRVQFMKFSAKFVHSYCILRVIRRMNIIPKLICRVFFFCWSVKFGSKTEITEWQTNSIFTGTAPQPLNVLHWIAIFIQYFNWYWGASVFGKYYQFQLNISKFGQTDLFLFV